MDDFLYYAILIGAAVFFLGGLGYAIYLGWKKDKETDPN